MSYNQKQIKTDVNDKPVPQYFNKDLQDFEVLEGQSGASKVITYDSGGNEINVNIAVQPILDKLTQLTGTVIDEEIRKDNELGRISKESARVTTETSRVNAESTRVSNENIRKSNETARQTSESGRVTEEGKRVTAESNRVSAESLRVSSENTRKSNEDLRITLYDDLLSKVASGFFKGVKGDTGNGLEYTWNGTQLGVRIEGDAQYVFVDLKGEKGDTGERGLQGDKGDAGPRGEQGLQGPKGDKGDDGYTPTKGVDYFDGDKGEKGDKGDTGKKGDKGDTGKKGEKGDTGEQGEQGLQGPKGDKGDDGYTPTKGVDYFDGIDGKDGEQGLPGDKGEKGDKGEQGPKGDKGNDGYTPIKGIDYFDGVDGQDGDKGEQGDKGDKGDKGEQGLPGEDGSDASVTSSNITGALGYTPVSPNQVLTDVPVGAKFTDTVYSHPPTHPASMITDLPTGKKVVRFVVGTSTAGWTAADCDYLCDGTADQTEINAAITALPATGGEIVILDGTYNITTTIDVTKDNVSIRGNGNATILKRMFNSTSPPGVMALTGRSGCNIANLQVDGNSVSYTASGNSGISLGSSSNNTIIGNTCNNNSRGIVLFDSSNNTVTGNTCIRGTGLETDYTASQQTMRLADTDNNYNLISNNNCMGKAPRVDGGTGNSVYGNKYDSGDYKDFTQDEKTKLAGISDEANKYTHPDSHPASMITQDVSNLFVAESEKANWNSKAKISDIPTRVGQLQNDKNYVTQGELGDQTLETYTEKIQATTGIINLSLANVFTDTPSASRTYSITNAKSGVAHSFTLIVIQPATVYTITFPANVKWQGGEIPDMSEVNKTYVLTFMTVDGGTTWLGMFGGEF